MDDPLEHHPSGEPDPSPTSKDGGKAKGKGLWKNHKVEIVGVLIGVIVTAYFYYKGKNKTTASGSTVPAAATDAGNIGADSGGGDGGGDTGGGGTDFQPTSGGGTTTTGISTTSPPTTVNVPGQNGATVIVAGNSPAGLLFGSNPKAPIFQAGVDPNSPFATSDGGAYNFSGNDPSDGATTPLSTPGYTTPQPTAPVSKSVTGIGATAVGGSPAAQVLAGASPSTAGLKTGTTTKHSTN